MVAFWAGLMVASLTFAAYAFGMAHLNTSNQWVAAGLASLGVWAVAVTGFSVWWVA